MTPRNILTFIDGLIAFYEREEECLLSQEPLSILSLLEDKEKLEKEFKSLLDRLNAQQESVTKIWPLETKQLLVLKLKHANELAALNEEKITELTQKQMKYFNILYRLIQNFQGSHSTYNAVGGKRKGISYDKEFVPPMLKCNV